MDLSRNWLIPGEVQKKIENSTIFCAGCGLGALIALQATRVGFRRFILADGDIVTPDNLNRQPFFTEHIGKNKAEIVRALIKAINPEAEIQIIPRFLRRKEELTFLVEKSDFVVNTVDPDETFWELTEAARALKKVELHPLNVGWWSYVYVSLPEDPPLEEILGGKVYGYQLYQRLVSLAPQVALPPIVIEKLNEIIEGKLPFPQIATTSAVTAAINVSAIIQWLEKGRLEMNPIVVKVC